MKLILFKISLLMLMLSSSIAVADSSVFDVEVSGGDTFVIDGVNLKQRIIKFEDVEMYYDSSTKFYDANGNPVSSKSLQKDSRIRFEIDSSRRYVSRPTATKIWILP